MLFLFLSCPVRRSSAGLTRIPWNGRLADYLHVISRVSLNGLPGSHLCDIALFNQPPSRSTTPTTTTIARRRPTTHPRTTTATSGRRPPPTTTTPGMVTRAHPHQARRSAEHQQVRKATSAHQHQARTATSAHRHHPRNGDERPPRAAPADGDVLCCCVVLIMVGYLATMYPFSLPLASYICQIDFM